MHSLARKLVILTVLKVAAIGAIWMVAFAPNHPAPLNPAAHIAGAADHP